jgi:chemotaxis signal transduction protein
MWNKEDMTRGLGREGEPYLLFSLGGEIYGIHIERLREIVSPAGMKPLSPSAFKYCLELGFRGGRIPAIQASKFLDYPGGPEEPKSVLVVGDQDKPFGLLVDEIRGVWNIRETELKPFPRFVSSLNP